MNLATSNDEPEVVSGKRMIGIIGVAGLILSFVLVIFSWILGGCDSIQESISAYYYTITRNLFVGTLCALALCLLVYKGYHPFDKWLANFGAVCAVGVAFFPTAMPAGDCIIEGGSYQANGTMHYLSAGLLFCTFAVFSIYLFPRTNDPQNPIKRRNRIFYKICGYVILAAILLMVVWLELVNQDNYPLISSLRPVFVLETISLCAFSFSWLLKGKLIS